MLARSSKLRHPFGVQLSTPLLIPSFSSKGFGHGPNGGSGVAHIYEIAQEYLTDCMLLSAYDIHTDNIPAPTSAATELVVLDSGGYETSPTHDLSTVYLDPVADLDWTLEPVINVYDAWPDHIPAIFVSHDYYKLRKPLKQQIDDARELFGRYPRQLHCFLAKPETGEQDYVQIDNLRAAAASMSAFDVLGVTEKELGNSLLQRMEAIAALRLALDDADVSIPIHVFGSLDPVCTLLYFVSGGELFDGLTWLRFGFHRDTAIYSQNYGALRVGIHRRDDFVKASMMRNNLSYLSNVRNEMLKFLQTGDFAHFGDAAGTVRDSFELLQTRNKRVVA